MLEQPGLPVLLLAVMDSSVKAKQQIGDFRDFRSLVFVATCWSSFWSQHLQLMRGNERSNFPGIVVAETLARDSCFEQRGSASSRSCGVIS